MHAHSCQAVLAGQNRIDSDFQTIANRPDVMYDDVSIWIYLFFARKPGNAGHREPIMTTVMATANKIATFRAVQNQSSVSGDSNGINKAIDGSQAQIPGFASHAQVRGFSGDREGQSGGYQSRRQWFLTNGNLGESLKSNWNGVNTCTRGSMRPSLENLKLSGNHQILAARNIRPINCPSKFNEQVKNGQDNAHLQVRSGARMDAFKSDPSAFHDQSAIRA